MGIGSVVKPLAGTKVKENSSRTQAIIFITDPPHNLQDLTCLRKCYATL
uniref:Uncharacterized protein n=1 Tax=Coprothermobacter proteolyticus (strain ATCC 35245 / DSM 5265 / OCM 4 / BT) TaxID=309798 RepID=B5Y9Y3_COPPD